MASQLRVVSIFWKEYKTQFKWGDEPVLRSACVIVKGTERADETRARERRLLRLDENWSRVYYAGLFSSACLIFSVKR